ncbi:ATP-NAD kinase [Haloferax namakaokahaiae]|uniref:ATP-NAD kinase n=1 Tax=Haloferax namakaokahaiae TaxID=1748331 RepID=A0ABD5ZHA8_9EURY
MNFTVVGDASVEATIRTAGGTTTDDDGDVLVAVGEDALRAAALDVESDTPLVPVACDAPWSVARNDLQGVIEAIVADELAPVEHPVLSVRVGDEHVGRALFDVMLVTSEPAHISAYSVADARAVTSSNDGWHSLDTFRADGVVAATPLGSSGYARAAGGTIVGPGAGLAVVPVSPYATQTDSWVLQPPLRLRVEREESPVSLVLDADIAAEVAPYEPVVVEFDQSVSLLLD